MIPKILHQIWSDREKPLPAQFAKMAETWKYDYPEWEYVYWNEQRMNDFILEYFPQYWNLYNNFPLNIQRWDAIRYLILYQMGGMYVDFDFESLHPMDELLSNKSCCISKEPASHSKIFKNRFIINNSLMAATPRHIYMEKIIEHVFSKENLRYAHSIAHLKDSVFNITGQWVLGRVYNSLSEEERSTVYLIPPEYINPFDLPLAAIAKSGCWDRRLEQSIKQAYAIHYYFGTWAK